VQDRLHDHPDPAAHRRRLQLRVQEQSRWQHRPARVHLHQPQPIAGEERGHRALHQHHPFPGRTAPGALRTCEETLRTDASGGSSCASIASSFSGTCSRGCLS
jgi:hypothetical protein